MIFDFLDLYTGARGRVAHDDGRPAESLLARLWHGLSLCHGAAARA